MQDENHKRVQEALETISKVKAFAMQTRLVLNTVFSTFKGPVVRPCSQHLNANLSDSWKINSSLLHFFVQIYIFDKDSLQNFELRIEYIFSRLTIFPTVAYTKKLTGKMTGMYIETMNKEGQRKRSLISVSTTSAITKTGGALMTAERGSGLYQESQQAGESERQGSKQLAKANIRQGERCGEGSLYLWRTES